MKYDIDKDYWGANTSEERSKVVKEVFEECEKLEQQIKELKIDYGVVSGALKLAQIEIKDLEEEQLRKDKLFEQHKDNSWELVEQIKELKGLLDKSHNKGLTSDKHDKEVQEALNKD